MTLREAIGAIRAHVEGWPRLPAEPIALPRAVRRVQKQLDRSSARASEDDDALLERIRGKHPENLSPADIRRALWPAWRRLSSDAEHREWLLDLTRTALGMGRRSADRRLVNAWIDVFTPGEVGAHLASAARKAAERHDWPYRTAGQTFRLWDPVEGPRTLGQALLQQEDRAALLREAAIGDTQKVSNLVQASLVQASDTVAETSGMAAEEACAKLLGLVEQLGHQAILSDTEPWIVRALLRPWRRAAPGQPIKARIQRFLISKVGDPRFNQTRWLGIEQAWRERGHAEDAGNLRLILKRWLVTAAFETFFRIMGSTTDNPVQWGARERFWRRYLEREHVREAWFILGDEAEGKVRAYRAELAEAGGFGRFNGGATPSHSALLMQIGDIVIAEWTHNGSCCFWQQNAVNRPEFYKSWYDGRFLRNSKDMRNAAECQARQLGSEPLWEAYAHHQGWEARFGDVIQRLTAIRV